MRALCCCSRHRLLRFEQKAHAFVEQLHTAYAHAPFSAYDVGLIVALAEGLGYGRNRAFFRATGQYLLGLIDTVPEPLGHTFDPPDLDASRLVILRKLVEQWRTTSAWEMMREILLNTEPRGDAGGVDVGGGPCGPYTGRFFGNEYTLSRRGGGGADVGSGPLWPPVGEVELPTGEERRAATRAPAPHHAAPAPTRLPSSNRVGEEEPRELPIGEARRAATRAPAPRHAAPAPTRLPWYDRVSTLHPLDSLRAIFTGVGRARADILIGNVVLPFAMAVGLIENDHTLVMQAQTLYQTYPSLSSNRITRAMCAQLQLLDEPAGACQQQGLHYIYQQTCKEKRCDECIVGRRKL